MKSRLLSISGAAILFVLSNCTYNDIWSGEVPATSIDYMMFGYGGGFCGSCGEVYKILNRKLFSCSPRVIINPDAVPLIELPSSSYNLVSSLTSQIPKRIVTGSTSSINHIGTSFPDAGFTYIEVSQNKKVYRWYIGPGNLPGDLQDFVNAVNQAMSKLN